MICFIISILFYSSLGLGEISISHSSVYCDIDYTPAQVELNYSVYIPYWIMVKLNFRHIPNILQEIYKTSMYLRNTGHFLRCVWFCTAVWLCWAVKLIPSEVQFYMSEHESLSSDPIGSYPVGSYPVGSYPVGSYLGKRVTDPQIVSPYLLKAAVSGRWGDKTPSG